MEQQEKIMALIRDMDQLQIRPRLTAGVSIHNKKTGYYADPGSVTLCYGASLLKWMLLLGAGAASVMGWMWLCRRKREQKLKEKYRRKVQRLKRKMSKS